MDSDEQAGPELPAAKLWAIPAARSDSTAGRRISGSVQPSSSGHVHELLTTSAPSSGRGFAPLGVGRRQEEFEALDVARRRPGADVHVPAADPARARRDADLVLSAVAPHGEAGHRRCRGPGRRRARASPSRRRSRGPLHGPRRASCRRATPRRRPSRGTEGLERRMTPLHAGVGDADDDALSRVAESPDVGRADEREIRLDRGGGARVERPATPRGASTAGRLAATARTPGSRASALAVLSSDSTSSMLTR